MKSRKARALTRFQQRVYIVVRRIPKGEVHSYQWVARQLGNPNLARAVGQALKRNPEPVRTPCHRVIRADGSLGGYAWGVTKKRRLLNRERVVPALTSHPPERSVSVRYLKRLPLRYT